MNISLNEITEKRNQILNKQPLSTNENKPRKRSVTETNPEYLEVGYHSDTVESQINNNAQNDNYIKYINNKLGSLDRKMNSVINYKDGVCKYIVIFIIFVIIIAGLMALNDYLALTYTNINLH